jgi:hypothetical protein
MKNDKEWNKISDELTNYFNICGCQRKLKSIIDNLYSIYSKIQIRNFNFTGAEWLLLALLDKNSDAILHGINCEYPIINESSYLWEMVLKYKDSPYLEDN